MSRADEVRKQIEKLDRLRRWSREAEGARNSIRCFIRPQLDWKTRSVGFFRTLTDGRFESLSAEVTAAMYEALAVVRDDYDRQARALEHKIEKGESA